MSSGAIEQRVQFNGFDDLITERAPPPNRVRHAAGDHEHHLFEGAVMVAYAMHLLRTAPIREVRIHPDGEHGKQFDFSGWLGRRGFSMISSTGKTAYGGIYTDGQGRRIVVNPRSGQGDVVAKIGSQIVLAECKGGIINTRHPGQVSRLSKGLCETVGLLMAKPLLAGKWQSYHTRNRRSDWQSAWRRGALSQESR
jgi:hypothetical protein